jgi:ribonuclease D
MPIFTHQDDLPADIDLGKSVAIDTEAMGLKTHRDRLCVVQLSAGDGDAHLVKINHPQAACPQSGGAACRPDRSPRFFILHASILRR